ncbi:MAG TPA: Ig-like domain-containing protein, partial [Pirellulales bacterium]
MPYPKLPSLRRRCASKRAAQSFRRTCETVFGFFGWSPRRRPARSRRSSGGSPRQTLRGRLLGAMFAGFDHHRARAALMVRHPLLECLERREMLSITANGDTYYTSHNASLTIPAYAGVLANDVGNSLSAILVSGPNAGTLTLNSDGSFTYTNTMMAMGDSFSYKDYDGSQYSNVATVSLSFSGGQPQAAGDSFNALHDRTFSENAPGVLANDNDPNHLHLSAVLETNPSHGSVTLNSDGSLAYTPATHYTGSDSFTYEAYNGSQYSSPATVNVSVTNQAPAAINDSYALPNDQPFNTTAATGVLANDGDPDGDALSASLVSGPSHGTLALNADGSFTYTPDAHWVGSDSFVYSASDGVAASQATVTLVTQYSVLTAVDQTKIPVDTLQVSNQLFKVPLAYNSVAAQPDAVVEADLGLSTAYPTTDLITATLTFNGVQQPPVYYNMSTLNGSDSHIHLAMQVDTSGLATGRYAYSLVVTSPDMAAPATISGAVNVVNNSASPIGKGWDIPGMYRLFPNTASGVPAGVLLTTGDGLGWYFTQATGDAYTSPNGPYAFDTLTSVSGGGWKLLDKDGTTYNFNSAGYLTSSVLRTGATTTYNWNSGLLTSIVNPFSRAIDLGYTSGLLSSVSDYAGNLWTVAHTGANLTSITEPDPGSGSPVW